MFTQLDREFSEVLENPEELEKRLSTLKNDRGFNSMLGAACGGAFMLGLLAVSLIEYSGKRSTLHPMVLLGFLSMYHFVRAAVFNSEYRILLLQRGLEKQTKTT